MSWIRLAEASQLAEGGLLPFDEAGKKIMLTRVKGKIVALSRACPHRGADLKNERPSQGVITCSSHFWQFSLEDGASLQVPGMGLQVFETKEEDGFVYANL